MTSDDGPPTLRRTPARPAPAGRRGELLRILRDDGPATTASLAARTGLHENTLREHLHRLVDAGLAVRGTERRTTRGRPRTVYRAVGGVTRDDAPVAAPRETVEREARAQLTHLLLAGYGTGVADVEDAATRAGRAMAATLPDAPVPGATAGTAPGTAPPAPAAAQLRALELHLERVGFAPALDRAGTTFDLWRCPFLDLARARPQVVCRVHLGLAQGVLHRVGGPVRAERLVPFVGPRHCELHLSGVDVVDTATARATGPVTTEGAP